MKEERIRVLQEELEELKPLLSRATEAVLDQDVSRYPILILHRLEIDVGIPLYDMGVEEKGWRINVSTMEEFVTKQLIDMTKVDHFIKIFKDPLTHFCLFLIEDEDAQFIFIPR